MNNIFALIRVDYRSATRNMISILVLVGVVLIPALFAWFNVLASWNAFNNVKNLKIAVANADAGYTSSLFPLKINIGEQVISQLRANNDIDWVFVDEAQAIEGTKSEEYYAALVLPPNFSQEMMTFLAPGTKPVQIQLYVNEKKNPLSSLITGEAATDVSAQINESFVRTLNEVGLATIASLSTHLEDSDARGIIERMRANSAHVASELRSAADTADMFASLIGSSKPLVISAASLASSAAESMEKTGGAIANGAQAAGGLKTVLDTATKELADAFAASASSNQKFADEVRSVFNALEQQSDGAVDRLNALSAQVGEQIATYSKLRDALRQQAANPSLDPIVRDALNLLADRLTGVIERQQHLQQLLNQASTAVAQGAGDMEKIRASILADVNAAKAEIERVSKQYTNSLRPKLERLGKTLASIIGNFTSIGQDLSASASALQSGTHSLLGSLTAAENNVAFLASDLRDTSSLFAKLDEALAKAENTGDLSEVVDLVGSHPAQLAAQLAAPVKLDTVPVFEVDSYGSQMTPLYAVLGLWVGALLLSVLIRTDTANVVLSSSPQRPEPDRGAGPEPTGDSALAVLPVVDTRPVTESSRPLSQLQRYFGRFGIFAALALAQSTLVFVGLIAFVGVRPAYPFLLIFAGWVMSFVFSLITYTLVLSFGEAGKAIAVLLLVVQISAGGGAYPLSLLPQWFQNISPFLPVTHATTAVRAAIAGIYDADFWIAIGCLLAFIVPTLFIGLVLRLPMMKINDDLNRALESTKLM